MRTISLKVVLGLIITSLSFISFSQETKTEKIIVKGAECGKKKQELQLKVEMKDGKTVVSKYVDGELVESNSYDSELPGEKVLINGDSIDLIVKKLDAGINDSDLLNIKTVHVDCQPKSDSDIQCGEKTKKKIVITVVDGNYSDKNMIFIKDSVLKIMNDEIEITELSDSTNIEVVEKHIIIVTKIYKIDDFEEEDIENLEVEEIKVFPNPGNGRFNIELESKDEKPLNIAVYDMNGKVVYHTEFVAKNIITTQLDLTELVKGNYIMIIRSGKNEIKKKLIIN